MKIEGRIPKRKYLLLPEVYPYAKIGRQFFHFETDNDVLQHLNVDKDVLHFDNLEKSLNRLFEKNNTQCGIFTCNVYSFAIIKTSCSFFMLNSFATSYAGEPMNPNDEASAACLIEIFTIKCLANHILANCIQEKMIFDNTDDTTKIYYSLVNLSIKKKIFGKDILERKKVDRLLLLAGTNRGGISRNHKSLLYGVKEKYSRNQSNQCEVPVNKEISIHKLKSVSSFKSYQPISLRYIFILRMLSFWNNLNCSLTILDSKSK